MAAEQALCSRKWIVNACITNRYIHNGILNEKFSYPEGKKTLAVLSNQINEALPSIFFGRQILHLLLRQ